MDLEDVDIANAERDASPQEFATHDPQGHVQREYARLHPNEREETLSQTTSSAASSSVELQEIATPNLNSVRTKNQSTSSLSHHDAVVTRMRSQHSQTVGARLGSKSSHGSQILPAFGGGKSYPPPLPDKEEYVVEFDGHDDPLHGVNWPFRKKVIVSTILTLDSMTVTMASSIFSPATAGFGPEYGVSEEVATLAISLFIMGYATGPMVWAPMSELYGRKLPLAISAFGFAVFSIAVAVAKDLQTIFICRFFCGFMGSSPLAIVSAVFADIFNNRTRGVAIAIFSATVFMGPFLAPFMGGFITSSYLGWRWTEYISGIMGFTMFILIVFFVQETYPPVLLVGKASELRRKTRNWGIHAKQEEVEVDIRELISQNFGRPLRILFTETIVLLVTIYLSFIYGILYLFLTAYELVFQGVYGFNAGQEGLVYFGMIAGVMVGFGIHMYLNKDYVRKLIANNDIPVPEWRLPQAIGGGVCFGVGLFWFGWTGYRTAVPWYVPGLSGICSGCGIFLVFVGLLNYMVDAYVMFAASTIAGNTFLRSIAGSVFPLFATYMFDGMGIQWASTLIGCVAFLLVLFPIYFYMRGHTIRKNSPFAPALDLEYARKKDLEAQGQDPETENRQGSGGPQQQMMREAAGGMTPGGSGSEEKDDGMFDSTSGSGADCRKSTENERV